MEAPPPDPGLDGLRRDVLAALLALEERLRHHVDARVGESGAETRQYIDGRLTESAAETREYIDGRLRESAAETRQYIDGRLTESATETREYAAETRQYIDGRLTESAAETRRHLGVMAESLMEKMELLAEGVRANGERLDRFQGEVRDQFARVDRRLLRLQARLPRKPRP